MSTFNNEIRGRVIVAGTHTAAGGTTNFNFSCPSSHPIQTPESLSVVPFAPNPNFIDRPEILKWVHEKCVKPGGRAALVGIGGVGKSQLALQYVHRITKQSPRPFVFWVHASTRARFGEAYKSIANKFELPGRDADKVDVLKLVKNWLEDEKNGRWIMVLDSAGDIDTFFPLVPQEESDFVPLTTYLPLSSNGSVLITARNKTTASRLAGDQNNIVEVRPMSESQAVALLRSKLIEEKLRTADKSHIASLVNMLDRMPLAISQAAAYINCQAIMSVSDYSKSYRASGKTRENFLRHEALDLRRDESASNSVMTVLQMSLNRLQQERPSATDLLSLMSFFNHQGIPEPILRRHSLDSSFDDDLNALHAYSLISLNTDNRSCEIHALVQFCTRVWLNSLGQRDRWQDSFTELLAQELPDGKFENWATCKILLPHVAMLYHLKPGSESMKNLRAQVLESTAWYLYEKGDFFVAQKLAKEVARVREMLFGPSDRRTLCNINTLSLMLRQHGSYEEAETLSRHVLESTQKELGLNHPNTITMASNLATILLMQGKQNEAKSLHRQVLECKLNRFGVNDHRTLITMKCLASVLSRRGNYVEAEKLMRIVLSQRDSGFGALYLDTFSVVHDLADILTRQERWEEAAEFQQRAFEGRHTLLGPYHPDTLNSAWSFSRILISMRRFGKAVRMLQHAYDGLIRNLGHQHPQVIRCGKDVAALQESLRQNGQLKNSK